MQKKWEVVISLNEQTLRDLVAVHLQAMGAVANSEDINVTAIGSYPQDGCRQIIYTLEPKQEVIFHE